MKTTMSKNIFVLFLSLLLMACTTGTRISASSIPTSNQYYAPTNYVDLYFGSYPGEKKYEQISFIEVLGGEYSKTDELVKELKRKAKSLGADAVINVHKGRMEREKIDGALLFINIASQERSDSATSTYRTSTLEGIAIKYIED